MSGENLNAATEPAVEDEHDEHDADFDAGFSGQDETPTATPAPTPAPSPAATPAPTPAPAPEYVQLTKADWEAVSARAAKVDSIEATVTRRFDEAFGKMGGMQREIAKVVQATPQGQEVELPPEFLAEYPEIAAHMKTAFGKLKGTGGADHESVKRMVTEALEPALATVRQETVDASLEAVFPGWKADAKTEKFTTWLNGQAEDVKALASSDKVSDAARMLHLFYKAVEAPPAPPATPTSTPAPTPAPSTARTRQLAAAVPPKGSGGHAPAPAEDDDFNEGFKYRDRGG